MRPSDPFSAAVEFAAKAHAGQRYGIDPYILHPLRVAMAVPSTHRTIAVLHDCLEDAGRLPEWLDQFEHAALFALTHRKDLGESYEDYIARVAKNPAAVVVKLADLRDNLSHRPSRRQRERYEQATARLLTGFYLST